MHFKGSSEDIAQIGRELDVDYVVEGSVLCNQGRIGINVQLIEAGGQSHLWARKYDAELCDLFGMQSAIVQEIAAQIGVVPPRTARKPTKDLDAYNLYIQGRHLMFQLTLENMTKAKQCFEEAVARDAKFALAYDSLAELHWYVGFFGMLPPKQASSTGVLAAMRALELDNTLAETHALLGWCVLSIRRAGAAWAR